MATRRTEDIIPETDFGQKLYNLAAKHGLFGAAAIGRAIYDNNACFKLFSPRGRESRYPFNYRKDFNAIQRRIVDHLCKKNAYEISGNYMLAYSILFDCSMDYLYGLIDEECPNLEILDISKKTGLPLNVIQRFVLDNKDGEYTAVNSWSAILASPLYDSIHEDWSYIINTFLEKRDLEEEFKVGSAMRKYLTGEPLDEDASKLSWIFDSINDKDLDKLLFLLDSASNTAKKVSADKDAAIYGMLSKISKNLADFIEKKSMDHFEERYSEWSKEYLERFKKRFLDKDSTTVS